MTADVPELAAHLGYWLRQVSNHVSHAFARKLALKDVTVAEWVLMRVLHGREPMPPSHIAETMGMTRGAITKLADRLMAKSLIARDASHDDGRSHTLRLTAQGVHLVPELAALAEQNEAECFADLSDKDRGTLLHILKKTVTRFGLTVMPID